MAVQAGSTISHLSVRASQVTAADDGQHLAIWLYIQCVVAQLKSITITQQQAAQAALQTYQASIRDLEGQHQEIFQSMQAWANLSLSDAAVMNRLADQASSVWLFVPIGNPACLPLFMLDNGGMCIS